jgi:hypothetical protein
MENDKSERVTFVAPVMQALTFVPFGTPLVQLVAEPQSPDGPLPVQLSVQLIVSVAGGLPCTKEEALTTTVVPATASRPAKATANRRVESRYDRPPSP